MIGSLLWFNLICIYTFIHIFESERSRERKEGREGTDSRLKAELRGMHSI